jgi:tRNA A-37 threonylcarbamoyl transferase component Bud32
MKPMAAKPITTSRKKKEMAPLSLEGQSLGKYRILEPLGRGGMAQVYKAYHPSLDRYVAVKVLRSDLVEEAEFLARFRREARAVAALRHPNIVQIYDFDVQDDLYYMVMELLEGDTLKAYMNALRVQGERLPAGEMVRIFNDVLAGLAYAHSEGIIHRDLKPANIMLTRKGQAVLTDFGIAQIVGGTQYTISGALMGTLSYMAPEQGLNGHCDVRSDIYSLGIAYYEALTGSVPFDADTPLAILMKHINDPLPLPRKSDPTIPEPFERIALKALAKRPEDRFQSAAEMAGQLSEAAKETSIDVPVAVHVPQRFSNPAAAKTGPVAVFSGPARSQIAEAEFAKGDTDITFGKKGLPVMNRIMDQGRRLFTPPARFDELVPKHVAAATLYSVGGIIFVNMALLWLSGIFGWKVFGHGWPLEITAAGVLLSALMAALATPWLFIPAGILLGNGLLFSYFTLTGWWNHWTFLWPLEPLLVGLCIVAPFILMRLGRRGNWLARRIGLLLIGLAVIDFLITVFFGIVLP